MTGWAERHPVRGTDPELSVDAIRQALRMVGTLPVLISQGTESTRSPYSIGGVISPRR